MNFKLAVSLTCFLFGMNLSAAPVEIQVQNVTQSKGPIYIALFNSKASWDKEEPSSEVKIEPVTKGTSVTKLDLPAGEYAFFSYHDLDGNGELATTVLGFPAEPYAFSNNFKLKMSKPSFADLKFKVTDKGAIHIVKLNSRR